MTNKELIDKLQQVDKIITEVHRDMMQHCLDIENDCSRCKYDDYGNECPCNIIRLFKFPIRNLISYVKDMYDEQYYKGE